MRFIINPSTKGKYILIFLPGFQKDVNYYNISESGKNLNIEETFRTVSTTILVIMEDVDYLISTSEFCNKMFEHINEIVSLDENRQWIVIGHSLGGLYAIKLAELYHNNIHGLLLIDPTTKCKSYQRYLGLQSICPPLITTKYIDDVISIIGNRDKSSGPISSQINDKKFLHYDSLPDGLNLSHRIRVIIHLSQSLLESTAPVLMERLEYFSPIVQRNSLSELILHPEGSHMLHYTRPEIIIRSLKRLIKE
jgi:pimeloyl-ACP methyl ester carboxylesterase